MISIAIDGPAGAGKSSISRKVSEKLGYIYVDTGALYRAIGLTLDTAGISPEQTEAIEKKLAETTIDIAFVDGEQRVLVNGNDVSGEIRTPKVSMLASAYSALPEVRAYLLGLQRGMAEKHNVIMDGRDIGTVVLPNAEVKIYLTASAETRADRRYKELCEKGVDAVYEDVLNEIKQRDYNDMHREVAPLKAADDAVTVDNSDCDLEQSVELLISVINERIK